jgi:hypothetical protein
VVACCRPRIAPFDGVYRENSVLRAEDEVVRTLAVIMRQEIAGGIFLEAAAGEPAGVERRRVRTLALRAERPVARHRDVALRVDLHAAGFEAAGVGAELHVAVVVIVERGNRDRAAEHRGDQRFGVVIRSGFGGLDQQGIVRDFVGGDQVSTLSV